MTSRGWSILRGSGDYTDDVGSFTEVDALSDVTPATFDYSWSIAIPRAPAAGSCGICVFCHGADGTEAYLSGGNQAGTITAGSWQTQVQRTLLHLLELNFVVMCSQHGGTGSFGGGLTDGTGEAMTRLDEQVDYLRALPETRTDVGALFIGQSMGHLTAYNYTVRNPTKVAAVYGVVPLCDAEDFYEANDDDNRSTMNEAHHLDHPDVTVNGVVYSARGTGTNGATWGVQTTYDPQYRATAGDLTSLPYAVEYATDDTIIDPATQATFATTISADITRVRNVGDNHATWIQDDDDVDALLVLAGLL